MLRDTRVGAIVFYVRELKRTTAFYRDTLGLKTKDAMGHDGPFVIAEAGGTLLIFFQRAERPGKTPHVVFTLDQGIDDVVEQLTQKGVEIVLPVSEAPDGGLSSDFLDPDGHVLSVYQPVGALRRRNR